MITLAVDWGTNPKRKNCILIHSGPYEMYTMRSVYTQNLATSYITFLPAWVDILTNMNTVNKFYFVSVKMFMAFEIWSF